MRASESSFPPELEIERGVTTLNFFSRAEGKAELSLVIARADGTVEDLGVVWKSHYTPLERVQRWLKSTRMWFAQRL